MMLLLGKILGAVTIMVVTTWLVTILARAWRSAAYRSQTIGELSNTGLPILDLTNPSSDFETVYRAVKEVFSGYHNDAVSAQNRYQDRAAAMAGLAFLALSSLAISVVVSKSGMLKEPMLWVELTSLSVLAWLFWEGRHDNAVWVNARAKAEIARSQRFLFALRTKISATDNLRADFSGLLHKLLGPPETTAGSKNAIDISERRDRRHLESANLHLRNDLTTADLLSYLKRRVARQLNWFRASAQRLRRELRVNKAILLILYVCTVLVAVLKLVSFYADTPSFVPNDKTLALALLILAATSTGITYYFSGRGTRSALHKYEIQAEQIEDLANNFIHNNHYDVVTFENGSRILSDDERLAFSSFIASFENLMATELIEWSRITQRDSIELG